MRMLMDVVLPVEKFNEAVRDGTAGEKIGRILEEIKPDSVYFTERNGRRGATLIIDVKEPAQVPALAEPWFLLFDADVHFRIAMSPDDLQKAGLDDIAKKWA